jgi:homoserine acetyltransferase
VTIRDTVKLHMLMAQEGIGAKKVVSVIGGSMGKLFTLLKKSYSLLSFVILSRKSLVSPILISYAYITILVTTIIIVITVRRHAST